MDKPLYERLARIATDGPRPTIKVTEPLRLSSLSQGAPYGYQVSHTSEQLLMRLAAALHHFATELDAGACPEIEATAERLERTIRQQLPLVQPVEARIAVEMTVQEEGEAGRLHLRVLHAFDLELVDPDEDDPLPESPFSPRDLVALMVAGMAVETGSTPMATIIALDDQLLPDDPTRTGLPRFGEDTADWFR